MQRTARLIAALFLFCAFFCGAANAAELLIYVTYTNDRAGAQYIRVQILDHTRNPIAEGFTNDRGQARIFSIRPGEYRLRITGNDIQETVTNFPFMVTAGEGTHNEFVQVKRIESAATSNEGAISAARLKIPEKARDEFDKGMEAFGKKSMEEAAKHFLRAVEIYPKYAAAFTNLGVIAMQAAQVREGAEYFRQAIAADEQYAPPYTYLAKIVGRKDAAESERLLNKALTLDPQNPDALMLLTVLEYQSGRYEMIGAQAKRIHEMPHEGFAYAHFVAGRAYEAKALRPEAIKEFNLYLKEAPNGSMAQQAREAIDAALRASK
jgi:tetratricopeptide (TPR) repeat protein